MNESKIRADLARAQAGDRPARDRVILATMPLVRSYAVRLAGSVNGSVIPDLEQAAVCGVPTSRVMKGPRSAGSVGGVMRAIEKWDPRAGVKWSTYVVPWIRAAMRDELLQHAGSLAPKRRARDLRAKYRRIAARLEAVSGEPPTPEEVLAEIEDPKHWDTLEAITLALAPAAREVLMGESVKAGAGGSVAGSRDHGTQIPDGLPGPDAQLDDRRNAHRLEALMRTDLLTVEEKACVRAWAGYDPASLRAGAGVNAAARQAGTHPSTESRRLQRALEKLREALVGEEDAP